MFFTLFYDLLVEKPWNKHTSVKKVIVTQIKLNFYTNLTIFLITP